ncbi:ABC transporter permease, partial [Mesorhizobium sp. M7A.F.Ca.US.006.04.2.1]
MVRSVFNILNGRNTRQGLWGLPLLVALLISLWLTVETTQFATAENLFNLVAQAMPLIIAAIGQLVVVLIGG